MTLRVIGTGFGRTGTDSMREALNILGFGPCHHMYEVKDNDEQERLWRALAAGEAPDWPKLFAGFNSCVDWPSAFYWPQLIKAYPEARVILTYRSAESWWDSFQKTILNFIKPGNDPETLGVLLIARQVFGGNPEDRDAAIAAYEANVKAVMATVPPERLLVYNLGDGWGPLCAHLGVPAPDQPYPNRNNAESFVSDHLKD
jgi:hypothetical protein